MTHALLHTLDRVLYEAGSSRKDLAPRLGVTAGTVSRQLGDGRLPTRTKGGLDGLVRAVADLGGVEPIQIWTWALYFWHLVGNDPERWKHIGKQRAALLADRDRKHDPAAWEVLEISPEGHTIVSPGPLASRGEDNEGPNAVEELNAALAAHLAVERVDELEGVAEVPGEEAAVAPRR